MEHYYQLVLVLILAYLMEANAASIDIALKIDTDQAEDHNEYKFHGRSMRHNERVRPKKHFLEIHPGDYAIGSRNGAIYPQPNLSTRNVMGEDQDPNYPREEIISRLRANPKLLQYFTRPVPNIGNRGGGSEDEGQNLCNTRKDPFYSPQKLMNTRGDVRTIVNDDNHLQLIEREICEGESSGRCNTFEVLGYTSVCVQKYSNRRLMVFNGNANNTDDFGFDSFPVATCCVCQLKVKTS